MCVQPEIRASKKKGQEKGSCTLLLSHAMKIRTIVWKVIQALTTMILFFFPFPSRLVALNGMK